MSGSKPIVGILGGGQLAMMLAQAGDRIGIECIALDPDASCPASHACEVVTAHYDDESALRSLSKRCDAVTYEFENVPVASAELVAESAPIRPGPDALRVAQDRTRERAMFERLGIATPQMAFVESFEEFKATLPGFPLPALLKATRFGYDGKGQAFLTDTSGAEQAWETIGHAPAILDQYIEFELELSVLAVRSTTGQTSFYPLCENVHDDGILRVTRAPAEVSDAIRAQAHEAATRVLDHLGYFGVLAVEFFQLGSGADATLLANEIAPRVHNTGHWTIEGAQTSQFENHLRAVLGMELGPTDATGHSAMVNIIGAHEPESARSAVQDAHWHDYHKTARPGRKLGHVSVVSDDASTRDTAAKDLRQSIED